MVFIDWLSPHAHLNFNKSFFDNLKNITIERIYVSDKRLIFRGQKFILFNKYSNRITRFLSVLLICLRNGESKIFFLTYDSVFIIFFQIFRKNIYVYEHNTTPESSKNKHGIFQKLFYKNIVRFAQFKGQYDQLQKMGQKCHFIGFPMIKFKKKPHENIKKDVFLIPSSRLSVDEIKKNLDYLTGQKIIIKGEEQAISLVEKKKSISYQDYIEIEDIYPTILAILITIKSSIRGTGWFNEAIAFGIPLIITNNQTRLLFKRDYPDYPFADPSKICSKDELNKKLDEVDNFSHKEYIQRHNENFSRRFYEFFKIQAK